MEALGFEASGIGLGYSVHHDRSNRIFCEGDISIARALSRLGQLLLLIPTHTAENLHLPQGAGS